MLEYTGAILVPGLAGEWTEAGFTGRDLTPESAVIRMGSGSVWVHLYPAFKGANWTLETTEIGPVSWSLGTNPGELVS